MTLALVEEEIRGLKSPINKKRSRYIVNRLFEYSEGVPTTALYIEFMSNRANGEIVSPEILARMGRYIRQNRTINSLYRLPIFVGGYIVFRHLVDRKSAWAALAEVKNKSVQAFLALMLSGVRSYKYALFTRIKEYDRESGTLSYDSVKVSPLAKKYLDAQYDRAIAEGLGPDSFLFYKVRRTEI